MPTWGGGKANPDIEAPHTEAPPDETTQDGEADQTSESDPNADA